MRIEKIVASAKTCRCMNPYTVGTIVIRDTDSMNIVVEWWNTTDCSIIPRKPWEGIKKSVPFGAFRHDVEQNCSAHKNYYITIIA